MNWVLDLAWRFRWQITVLLAVAALGWLGAELAVLHAGLDPAETEITATIRGWAGQLAVLCSVMLLPALVRYLDRNGDGKVDDEDFKPGAGGGAATIVVLVLALASQACSATAWDAHSYVAIGVRDGCNTMKAALRDHHIDFVRGAVELLVRGEDETDAEWADRRRAEIADASAAWREDHRDWMAASGTCAETSQTYNSAAYAGIVGNGDASTIVGVAREAAQAMAYLGDLLRRAAFPELPQLPASVRSWLGLPPVTDTGATE